MGQILVRGITDDAKERLRARAQRHGRTLEAEVRLILEAAAISPPTAEVKLGFGTALQARMNEIGITQEDWEEFDKSLREARKEFTMREIDFD